MVCTMRAPSVNLLRVLRHAASTVSLTTAAQASQRRVCCQKTRNSPQWSIRAQSSYSTAAHRMLSTHTTLHERSSPQPSPPASRTSTVSPRAKSLPPNPSNPSSTRLNRHAPKSHDRGPTSKEETQTDFSAMDIYASAGVEEPATSIDACARDGFALNNGVQTTGGRGVLLVGGEGFVWSPWAHTTTSTDVGSAKTGNASPPVQDLWLPFLTPKSVLSFAPQSLGLLALLYPKPDLLIFGTGRRLQMLSKDTRRYVSEELGISVDVMDTANAAAAYNLLVMERGVESVGAVLIPEGFLGR